MIRSIAQGGEIPKFDLECTKITRCRNIDFKNQWTVLFLYPKDNTSGCTKEAQEFNDLNKKFNSYNVKIFGLSKDSLSSHEKFSSKLSLKFPLISDPETELIQKLSCWVEKSMYGRKYMGVERTTFLINLDCEIFYIWRKVKVKNHAEEVLNKVMEVC